jgi:hypothetical protein
LKSLFSLPCAQYFIIILFEVVVGFADKVKRKSGEINLKQNFYCYTLMRGFMNWTRKPPNERAHLHQSARPHVCACTTNNNKMPYLLNPLSIKM